MGGAERVWRLGRGIRRALLWGVAAALGACAGAVLLLEASGAVGEFPRSLLAEEPESLRVLASDGSLLRETLRAGDQARARWVPLGEVAPRLLAALLAAEDARFFVHQGVDWRAILRAAAQRLWGGRSGASTLTQQVVKLLLREPRTLGAKWRELVLALRLERSVSKEEVLRQYVNRAPFGAREVGVEAGARALFGKPAREVSLAEAALLAGLPKSPVGYDPRRRPERALVRRDWVLGRMAALGMISEEERARAVTEPLRLWPEARPFEAPHFTSQVLRAGGASTGGPAGGTARVGGSEDGGTSVAETVDGDGGAAGELRTTLSPRLQRRAEVLVRRAVEALRPHGGSQAAAVVLENRTGAVLAYVGSADFHDAHEGQNDAVHARRQPGSALKPFAYALGFEGELTPASLLVDLPARFTTASGEYSPRNYDARFHGPVLARQALASSYNVPAVRVAHRLSPGALLARLRACGFDGLAEDEDHYGLGLVLGNGEVSLWELARAYLALARGGERIEPVLVRGGARAEPLPRRIFRAEAAYLVSHVLADRHARQAAFGERSALELPFAAAVKTGTSTDFRDNWTAGYSTEVTVAVWVGNFSGKPMRGVSGVTGAAPLWNELMEAAMEGRPRRPFEEPPGLERARVCARSGLLAGPLCAHGRAELFPAGRAPTARCDVHVEVTVERRSGLLAGPGCPAAETTVVRGERYSPSLLSWAVEAGRPLVPRAHSPRCPAPAAARGSARLTIENPRDGDVLALAPDLPRRAQRLRLQVLVEGTPARVRWLVDGREVARAASPYEGRWTLEPGEHELIAEADGVRSAPVRLSVRE